MSETYILDIGPRVRNRLLNQPNCFQVPSKVLDIFVVRAFLSRQECEGLIKLIDADRQPSKILATDPDPSFRTSESCNLSPYSPLVQQVEVKITLLMGIEQNHGETIQGQRYAVGQQFKPHHDFFYPSEPYWEEQNRRGGQRTWTAMMFLNEPEAGGATNFPQAGVRVTPRRGNLLAWNNLDDLGRPNEYSLHEGMPVEGGVKYIITKWHRERPWT